MGALFGIGGNRRHTENHETNNTQTQAGQSQTGAVTNISGSGNQVTSTDHGAVMGALSLAAGITDGIISGQNLSHELSASALSSTRDMVADAFDFGSEALGTVEYGTGRVLDLGGDVVKGMRDNSKDFLTGLRDVVKDAFGFSDKQNQRAFDFGAQSLNFANDASARALDHSYRSSQASQTAAFSSLATAMTAQRDTGNQALQAVVNANRDAQTASNRALEQAGKLTRSDDADTSQTMIKWIAGALITGAIAYALPKMMK